MPYSKQYWAAKPFCEKCRKKRLVGKYKELGVCYYCSKHTPWKDKPRSFSSSRSPMCSICGKVRVYASRRHLGTCYKCDPGKRTSLFEKNTGVSLEHGQKVVRILHTAVMRYHTEMAAEISDFIGCRFNPTFLSRFLLTRFFRVRVHRLLQEMERYVPRWKLELVVPDMDLVYEYIEEE